MINSIWYKISKIITHNNTFKADKSVRQVCGLNACYVDAQKVRGGKMKTNKNNDFFNYFIRGLDSKAQAQLNLMYTHYRMMEEFNHRREMEEME